MISRQTTTPQPKTDEITKLPQHYHQIRGQRTAELCPRLAEYASVSKDKPIMASPTNAVRRKRVMRILQDLHTKQRQLNRGDKSKHNRKYKGSCYGGKLTKTVSGRNLLELQIPTAQSISHPDIGCRDARKSLYL